MSLPSTESIRIKRLALTALWLVLLAACAATPRQATVPASLAPPLQGLYDQALQALAADDLAAAEGPLRQVVEARPELATPRFNLGLVYARTGRDAAALEALREAARLDPGLAPAHTQLGILLRQAGDFQGARAAYQRALAADPDHARAHLNLGILYDLYLQQPALALQHYERFQALNGNGDPKVKMWIVDLRQRLKSLARNEPGEAAP